MKARRFPDILNWGALVAPGVVACRDGSLLAGWAARGPDTGSMEPAALAGALAHLGFAVSGLRDPHTVWVVHRRAPWTPPPPPAETGNTALDTLALETHALLSVPGMLWRDSLSLFLSWRPPEGAPSGMDGLLEAFTAETRNIEARFGGALALTRLAAEDDGRGTACGLCTALAGLLSPLRGRVRIAADALPVALDVLLGAGVSQPSRSGPLRIDDRPAAVLAIEGLPQVYRLAPLDRLQSLGLPCVWTTRYDALSPRTTIAAARRIQKFWRQSAADIGANIAGTGDGHRGRFEDSMAEAVENTVARASRGDEGHGRFVSHLLVFGEPGDNAAGITEASAIAREAALDAGFDLRTEERNAVPALLSALPGHPDANPRSTILRARALADLVPVRTSWRGSPTCAEPGMPPGTPCLLPSRGHTGEFFGFDPHVGDVGHTLLFGPTGSGKSALLGLVVAAWLRRPGARAVWFDRGASSRHACAAIGGRFLEPGSGAESGIAPLAHMDGLGSRWAESWLREMAHLGLGSEGMTVRQAEEIRQVAALMANGSDPDLAQVAEQVQDEALRDVFRAWLEPPRAGTFDHDGLDIAGGPGDPGLTVIETGPLLDGPEDTMRLSLDYIFATVALRFRDPGPLLVVLDEAWSFLRHDLFEARIRSWLKEGRKSRVAVLLATQSVADAAGSGITADLLENCPTRLFLPNPAAGSSEIAVQYASLGLSPGQVATVAAMRPRQDVYVMQPPGQRRVVSFPVGPAALSILGRTGTEDSARAAALAATDPGFWKEDLTHALAESP